MALRFPLTLPLTLTLKFSSIVKSSFLFLFLSFPLVSWASAPTIPVSAKQALLIDLTTGTVLLEDNADTLAPPSSMSKMMTVYMVFDAVKRGQLSFEDTFCISTKAWKMGGSRMFLKHNSQVSVRELVRGVIVLSGNDAAVALAEGIAGSEEAFVEMMNLKAKELGVEKGKFVNATGWPHKDHLLTAREIAIIAARTMSDFPEFYHFYSETEMTHNNIRQPNRNPVLYANLGGDGLKTGHTDTGGYGVAASALQDGRRLLLVINGCKNDRHRASEAKRLLSWGFNAFATPVYFEAGDTVEVADVWLGQKTSMPLYTKEKIAVTLPKSQLSQIEAEVVYKTPLEAPFAADQHVADVILKNPTTNEQKVFPLYTKESVEKIGALGRISAAFKYLVFGS